MSASPVSSISASPVELSLMQAHQEAVKRWGYNGRVRRNPEDPGVLQVGIVVMGRLFKIYGTGPDWAGAFADAEQKLAVNAPLRAAKRRNYMKHF